MLFCIGVIKALSLYLFVLLLFYVLATSRIISGWALTCYSAHLWGLYSAASLGNQATSTCYPTQSHFPDTEPTSPCPTLIMPTARLGSDTYKFVKSLVWLDQALDSNPRSSDSLISQNWRRALYSFGHPDWCCVCVYMRMCMRVCFYMCIHIERCMCVFVLSIVVAMHL